MRSAPVCAWSQRRPARPLMRPARNVTAISSAPCTPSSPPAPMR
ncbi:hypothetical protein [Lysobacter gummosus]